MNHQERSDSVRQARPSPGRSVRLFLADGTPQGLIVAEIPNWSGKVLAAPRARLGELLKRGEAARTGVYILTGPDPDRAHGQLAYLGEADDVAARIRIHVRSADKDFFDRVAVITSTDDNITKGHARFLESRLIGQVRRAGAVAIANGTQPDFQRLPEPDRADMEFFVEQLGLLLPMVGFDLFRRPVQSGSSSPKPDGADGTIFTLTTAGAAATGQETDDGFVVLAGSTARRTPTGTFPAGYLALRDQLVADGKLTAESSPELFAFTADVAFSSPSAAASIVAARSASGPREWRVTDGGQTYGDWKAARLDE